MRTHQPRKMADVLSELLARTGCARVRASEGLEEAWRGIVKAPLAEYTKLCHLRRGTLDVYVTHSPLLQELSFRKAELLRTQVGAGKLKLLGMFCEVEQELEPLEEAVNEVASFIDQEIAREIDQRRGK